MHTPVESLHPSELHTHRKKMFRVTLVALSSAVIIFVVAILPAEYGIDPLRTGKSLGFSSLYQGDGIEASALVNQSGTYNTDTQVITLLPGKGIEYKYRIAKGVALLFSWSATGQVYYDFHGEPAGSAPGYFESHETGDATEKHGILIAPFAGVHGWFWENKGAEPVTVTLETSGYYEIADLKKLCSDMSL